MVIDFKRFRDEVGVTPEDIALTLGISQTYTSLLLNGHRKMSKERWDLLTSTYSNITDYVIDYSNNSEKDEPGNITPESDIAGNITDKSEQFVPAFVLRMHDEERRRFDAQMDKMIEQNGEILKQNRMLVEAIREQTRNANYGLCQVADKCDPKPYTPTKDK